MSTHILPIRTYVSVFVALLVLLVLTVAASRMEQGPLNLIVGLSIAVAKAALIVLFFMHVRYNTAVIRLAAITGFVWLAILLVLTMSDFISRDWPLTGTTDRSIDMNIKD
jgi:cytochrome c oxidase subunit 4